MCCAKAEVSDEPEEGRYGEAALLAENHRRGSAEWDVDSGVCRQRRLKESQFYWWQPSHFQILLRKSGLRKKQFAHLRYVQQAGGHLAPSFVRELREALLGTEIFVMYGQTVATARLSYVPPEDLERKLGSIGKAISGVALRVLDDSGEGVVPGKIGEIVAEGANVTQGYWRAPEETAISFSEGKFYTGDLGTVDDEGFIQPVYQGGSLLNMAPLAFPPIMIARLLGESAVGYVSWASTLSLHPICARATRVTDAPGSSVSSTTRRPRDTPTASFRY